MSKREPLGKGQAWRVWLELFAAWPCPPSPGPRWRGWPSQEWEDRYRTLRRRLLTNTAPPAEEVRAELFELQRQLRDASEKHNPPPDIVSAWEQSFAALGRASALMEADY